MIVANNSNALVMRQSMVIDIGFWLTFFLNQIRCISHSLMPKSLIASHFLWCPISVDMQGMVFMTYIITSFPHYGPNLYYPIQTICSHLNTPYTSLHSLICFFFSHSMEGSLQELHLPAILLKSHILFRAQLEMPFIFLIKLSLFDLVGIQASLIFVYDLHLGKNTYKIPTL